MNIVCIIPARIGSQRLPNKMLLPGSDGRPLISHTISRVKEVFEKIVVATDSDSIMEIAKKDGVIGVLTGEHICGTDRVLEAATSLSLTDYMVVNVQGDEAQIDPDHLRKLLSKLSNDDTHITTMSCDISQNDFISASVVKVVTNHFDDALYFSRSCIPYQKERLPAKKHIGVYAYRYDTLKKFAQFPSSPLEYAEGLEQLRALEFGMKIKVVNVNGECNDSINTYQEYKRWFNA